MSSPTWYREYLGGSLSKFSPLFDTVFTHIVRKTASHLTIRFDLTRFDIITRLVPFLPLAVFQPFMSTRLGRMKPLLFFWRGQDQRRHLYGLARLV